MVSFTTDEQQTVKEVAPFIPNTSKELLLSIQQSDSDWSLLQVLTWRLKHDKDWHRSVWFSNMTKILPHLVGIKYSLDRQTMSHVCGMWLGK